MHQWYKISRIRIYQPDLELEQLQNCELLIPEDA